MADEEEDKVVPKKFDDYWLEQGKTMVDETLGGLEKRHQKLLTFVNYVGGGTFLGGIAFATILKTANPYVFGLFVVPLLIILIVKYRIGVELAAPEYERLDLRSPIQIQNAYNAMVDRRRAQLSSSFNELQWALAAVILFFPAGIFVNNYFNQEKESEPLVVERFDNSTKVKLYLDSEQNVRLSFFGAIRDTAELKPTDPKEKWVYQTSEAKKDEPLPIHIYDADLEVHPKLMKVEYEEGGLKKIALKAIVLDP